MQIYKDGASQICLGGITYPADENGIIDVPDEKISNRVWESGFVSAHGRLALLAREREQQPIIAESMTSETTKPTKAVAEKATAKDLTIEKDKSL